MACKSPAGGIEKNSSLSSVLYCKSDLKEGSLQWAKGKRTGLDQRVLRDPLPTLAVLWLCQLAGD